MGKGNKEMGMVSAYSPISLFLRFMKVLKPLLFPFSILYHAITAIRNRLYDLGIKPSARFEVTVISVGNLSVGGTGKTPMIEYLIRLLAKDNHLATLSRGYGRKTKGIRIAGDPDDPSTIGDEPFQFYKKFKGRAIVAVGEERALAIPYILNQYPDTDLILLDDAFQHRKVQPAFQILLTDFHNLFIHDLLLPAGRLRESRAGAERADVIVVTKCPSNVTDEALIEIERLIREYSNKAIFFSRICYRDIVPVNSTPGISSGKVVLVSGIANPKPMEHYLRQNYDLVKQCIFPDHYVYTKSDLQMICEAANKEKAVVITTEKDIVKMNIEEFESSSVSLNYLPIEIEFIKNGKEFDEMVHNVLRKHGS